MKRAIVLLKPSPHYRRDSFVAGLQRLGFTIVNRIDKPRPDDVFVTWNLSGGLEKMAQTFERAGARVLVMENGYLSPPDRPMYAISLGGHNGAGRTPTGDASRWEALGIQCKPWRTSGKHYLVCGQRGIGSREMASPHAWHQKTAEKLQRVTSRPIRTRAHPGNRPSGAPPLQHDLRDALACVIWASSSGVRALVEGVPVFYAAPHWICAAGAYRFKRPEDIEQQLVDDAARAKALHHMANGQWDCIEIATGEPLLRTLEC